MVRLYANENFPAETVQFLREQGHDILTTHETGNSNLKIPDEDVLAFAIADRRAVITVNRKDFKQLHRANSAHFGIIVCPKNDDFEHFARCIQVAIQENGSHLAGQLIRVYKGN